MTALLANPAATAESEREPRACETCGHTFPAVVVRALGARIVARHCPACVAAREAESRRAAAAVLPPTAEQRWAALCPREFRTVTEGGRTDLPRLQALCPELARITQWPVRDRGLLLRGATGACKTRAMWRLLRRLFDEGRSLRILTAGEWGRSYGDAAGQYQSSAWFTHMTTVDILCIDDLGKGAWSDAVRAVFFDVVDHRMRSGRPLIVTTNDDGQQIADKMREPNLGAPLVRRLREFCEVIVCQIKPRRVRSGKPRGEA